MKKLKYIFGAVALFALVVANVWNAATVVNASGLDVADVEAMAQEPESFTYEGNGMTTVLWSNVNTSVQYWGHKTDVHGGYNYPWDWNYGATKDEYGIITPCPPKPGEPYGQDNGTRCECHNGGDINCTPWSCK